MKELVYFIIGAFTFIMTILFYCKDTPEPIKLQMSENKSEIIELVKHNYNKEN